MSREPPAGRALPKVGDLRRDSRPRLPIVSREDRVAGYTLLELLVVLAIIALLSGLAVSTFPGRSDVVELEATARRVADLVGEARAAALDGGTTVALSEAGSGRFRLLPQGSVLELPPGASASASGLLTPSIRFYPDGSSSGGTVEIRKGAWRATVEIGWFDGAPRVMGTARDS